MPYYIYAVSSWRTLRKLGQAERYAEAKAMLTHKRAAQPVDADELLRMIFAADELTAEELLANPRPAPPAEGDDD